jgi:hypothetical protein
VLTACLESGDGSLQPGHDGLTLLPPVAFGVVFARF